MAVIWRDQSGTDSPFTGELIVTLTIPCEAHDYRHIADRLQEAARNVFADMPHAVGTVVADLAGE